MEKISLTSHVSAPFVYCVHTRDHSVLLSMRQPFFYQGSRLELVQGMRFCLRDWIFNRRAKLTPRGTLVVSAFDPQDHSMCLGTFMFRYLISPAGEVVLENAGEEDPPAFG